MSSQDERYEALRARIASDLRNEMFVSSFVGRVGYPVNPAGLATFEKRGLSDFAVQLPSLQVPAPTELTIDDLINRVVDKAIGDLKILEQEKDVEDKAKIHHTFGKTEQSGLDMLKKMNRDSDEALANAAYVLEGAKLYIESRGAKNSPKP